MGPLRGFGVKVGFWRIRKGILGFRRGFGIKEGILESEKGFGVAG